MYLKEIKIENYRKYKDVKMEFNEIINILAGSNNSGKTSIVELFNIIFNENSFQISDLNNDIRCEVNENINRYYNLKNENFTEKVEISDEIKRKKINIYLIIEYLEDDNISLIGEFITELFSDNKQIYLMLECYVNTDELENEKIVMTTKYYYSNSNFEIKDEIDRKKFKEKFNYKMINAKRDVNDIVGDKSNLLSKNLHVLLKDNEEWKKNIQKIRKEIEQIGSKSNEKEFSEIFNEIKENYLKILIEDFQNTNGGNIEELKADLSIDETNLMSLLEKSILLKYDFNGVKLTENSQGLGYSNLLYILMEFFKYEKNIDETKINILVIEEPESHMHPSMERNLIKYINNEKNVVIQKIITSHSKEIVEFVALESIKVLKSINDETKVFDLNAYCKDSDTDDVKFVKKFFNVINDVLFADKIIMFEGDSERIYLNHIINSSEIYKKLKNEYISYIQVGGRHAKSYRSFVEYLEMKILIFSDIDYEKKRIKNKRSVQNLTTSNETILNFFDGEKNVRKISEEIMKKTYRKNEMIACFTQTKKDGYARSFEDAIMFTLYQEDLQIKNVFSEIKNNDWKTFNKSDKNIFKIANVQSGNTNLVDRSMQLKGSKTDFVYDLIYSENDGIPYYIRKGLKWLMEE